MNIPPPCTYQTVVSLENFPEQQDQIKLEKTEVPFDDELHMVKTEQFEATEYSVQEQSEWCAKPKQNIDGELKMVLELEDLRAIGALPDELLQQLDKQTTSSREDFISSPEELDELQCKICYKHYETRDELDAHELSHCKQRQSFGCKYCEKRFYRKSSVYHHEKRHEQRRAAGRPEPDQGKYKCTICNKGFHKSVNFNRHVRMHQATEKGTYQCKICDYAFGTAVLLKRHMLKHETKPEWKMSESKIPPPDLIKRNNQIVFKCSKCSRLFERRIRYYEHAHRHINRKTSKSHHCPDCGKSYGYLSSLQYHQRTIHNNVKRSEPVSKSVSPVEIEQKSLHCRECDAFFSNQACYEIHISTHKPLAAVDSIPGACVDPETHEEPHINIKSEITIEDTQLQEDTTGKDFLPVTPPSTSAEPSEPVSSDAVWKCVECGHLIMYNSVSMTYQQSYQEHQKMHYNLENITFKCETCKLVFTTSIELKQHREEIHATIDQKVSSDNTEECPFCKKLIKKGLTLRLHIKAHENINLKKHK